MDEQYRKWYKTKRWQRIRRQVLAEHPMCQCPHCRGRNLQASVVDHITPHRGDARLFWDKHNLQSMHKQCHDKFKSSQERGGHGFEMGSDVTGQPLTKDHPWYDT